jgi:hypothetical protein
LSIILRKFHLAVSPEFLSCKKATTVPGGVNRGDEERAIFVAARAAEKIVAAYGRFSLSVSLSPLRAVREPPLRFSPMRVVS